MRTGTKLVLSEDFRIVIAALQVGTNIPGQHEASIFKVEVRVLPTY